MMLLFFLFYSVTVVSGFAVIEASSLLTLAGDASAGVLSSQFHSTDNVVLYPQQPSSKLAVAAKEYSNSLRQQQTLTSTQILLSSTGTRTGTSSFPTNAVSGDGSTASDTTGSYTYVQETLFAAIGRGFVGENALRDIISSFSLLITTLGVFSGAYVAKTGMSLMSEDQKWRKEVRKEDVEWRKEEQERQEALRKEEQEREDALRKEQQEREDAICKVEQEHQKAIRNGERLFELKARQLDRVVDEIRYKEGKSGDLLRDIVRMQVAEAKDSPEIKMLTDERNAIDKAVESLQKQKKQLEEELDSLLLGAK